MVIYCLFFSCYRPERESGPRSRYRRRPGTRFSNRALFTNAVNMKPEWDSEGSENQSHCNRRRDMSAQPCQEREGTSETLEAHLSAGREFGAVRVSIQMVWAIAVSPGGMIQGFQVTEAGGQPGEAWRTSAWVAAVISQERPASRCHGQWVTLCKYGKTVLTATVDIISVISPDHAFQCLSNHCFPPPAPPATVHVPAPCDRP